MSRYARTPPPLPGAATRLSAAHAHGSLARPHHRYSRHILRILIIFVLSVASILVTAFINQGPESLTYTRALKHGCAIPPSCATNGACDRSAVPPHGTPCTTLVPNFTSAANITRYQLLPQYPFGTDTAIRAGGNAWSDPTLMHNLQQMDYQTIRFPGGLADEYDWHDGRYDLQPDGALQWGFKDTVTTLQQLKTLYDETHATPIFVLNIVTAGHVTPTTCGSGDTWDSRWQAMLDDQVQFLETAQNLGLPVKLVELGNEVYPPIGAPRCVFPNGAVYGSLMNYWTDALHKDFPGVQVALVGEYTSMDTPWNHDLLTTARNFDAITVHYYAYENVGYSPSLTGCALQQHNYATLKTPQGVADLLSGVSGWVSHYNDEIAQFPPNVKLWVTEVAPMDLSYGFSGTWAEALFAAAFYMDLMRNPQIAEMTDFEGVDDPLYADIFEGQSAGYTNARANCTPFPATLPYGLTAKGYTMQLLGQSLMGMKSQAPITFSPNPLLQGQLDSDTTDYSLMGAVYSDGTSCAGTVVNLTGKTIALDLHALPEFSDYTQVSSPDPSMLTTGASSGTGGPNTVTTGANAIPTSRRLILPPYSVTALTQADPNKLRTMFEIYAVDQAGKGVEGIPVTITDNDVNPTTYTSDESGRILVNTAVGHIISAQVASDLPPYVTSITPTTILSLVYDYYAKDEAGCGERINSCILTTQVAAPT